MPTFLNLKRVCTTALWSLVKNWGMRTFSLWIQPTGKCTAAAGGSLGARSHRGAPGQPSRNFTSQGPPHSPQSGSGAGQRWWPDLTKNPDLQASLQQWAKSEDKARSQSASQDQKSPWLSRGTTMTKTKMSTPNPPPKRRAKHGAELKWALGPIAGVLVETPAEADEGH